MPIGSANTIATYANDTMELSKQFKLVTGLRFDRYVASVSNSINSLNTPTVAKNTHHRCRRPNHQFLERASGRHLATNSGAIVLSVVRHFV